MSEIIRRVAHAIDDTHKGFLDPTPADMARAAIRAMREPTPAMLEAQFGQAGPLACWQAMIDAALSETPH